MVLLNDPRGEQVVRERDLERERLRKEGHTTRPPVDIWGDTALPNGAQWVTNTYSSDGSDEEEGATEVEPSQSTEERQDQSQSILSEAESEHTVGNTSATNSTNVQPAKVDTDINVNPVEPAIQESSPETPNAIDNQQNIPIIKPVTGLGTPSAPNSPNSSAHPNGTHSVADETVQSPPRPVVGDYLKMRFVEANVLPSVVDLFFAHPWNNFLHNVVYDILTQVLNGPMDKGFNRQLAIDLFTTGQLTEKILQGQKASDEAQYVLWFCGQLIP
jgi:SIT4-associating protein SAP185/190